MRYIRTDNPALPTQLLQITAHGQSFDLVLLHAEDERYPRLPGDLGFLLQIDGKPIPEVLHQHNVYHIVLYTQGECEVLLGENRYQARRGVLTLTAPGEPHSLYQLTSENNVIFAKELTFMLENENGQLPLPLHELFSLYTGMELPRVTFPFQLNERRTVMLEGLFDALFDRLPDRDETSWFAEKKALFNIISFIIEDVYLPESTRPTAQDLLVHSIKQEIDLNFAQKIRLDDLAQKYFISIGHLCRLFKTHFGISPIAYQHEVRIRTACILLRSTSHTIEEISHQVGYPDICSFSRAFHQSNLCSPSAYRKSRNKKVTLLEANQREPSTVFFE